MRRHPFAQVWDSEVVPLLKNAPTLLAITVLRKLQDDHPGSFADGVLRTLQRHIRQWRALAGPPKEVFFPQVYAPGVRGLSDFTTMGKLRITLAGVPFAHRLYHFVLQLRGHAIKGTRYVIPETQTRVTGALAALNIVSLYPSRSDSATQVPSRRIAASVRY